MRYVVFFHIQIYVYMDERKRIQINPDFFKIETNTRRRSKKSDSNASAAHSAGSNMSVLSSMSGGGGAGTRRKNPKNTSETLKRQLLKKIRQQQYVEEKGEFSDEEDKGNESEFENSLKFFDNMMKENKNKGMAVSNPTENVSLCVPEGFQQKIAGGSMTSAQATTAIRQMPTSSPEIAKQVEPQHGCLKNGSLPTYRNWITQKNYRAISSAPPSSIKFNLPEQLGAGAGAGSGASIAPYYSAPPSSIYNATISSLNSSPASFPQTPTFGSVSDLSPTTETAKNHIQNLINARQREEFNRTAAGGIPTKQKKTIRRIFNVGRSKKQPIVSVLVTNKTIRKKNMTDIQNLANVPIHEVKQFLQKKRLIKVGSVAPARVLRKMYENVFMLGGDVVNHNKETVLHNFLMGGDVDN